MMFSRVAALAIAAAPLLAAATPLEARTGTDLCCATTSTASAPAASKLLKLLDVVVQDVNVLVGIDCSPITVVGVGNSGCGSSTAVSCTDNSHGGLISIGCVPITL